MSKPPLPQRPVSFGNPPPHPQGAPSGPSKHRALRIMSSRASWVRSDCHVPVGSTPFTLLLTLQSAYDLRCATSCDLYCKVYVGESPVEAQAKRHLFFSRSKATPSSASTSNGDHRSYHSSIYHSTHPSCAKWNDELEIPLLNEAEVVSIRVKCVHTLSCPTVGTCVVPLKNVRHQETVDRILKLRKDSKRAGNLRLQLCIVRNTACLMAPRTSTGPVQAVQDEITERRSYGLDPVAVPIVHHVDRGGKNKTPSSPRDQVYWSAKASPPRSPVRSPIRSPSRSPIRTPPRSPPHYEFEHPKDVTIDLRNRREVDDTMDLVELDGVGTMDALEFEPEPEPEAEAMVDDENENEHSGMDVFPSGVVPAFPMSASPTETERMDAERFQSLSAEGQALVTRLAEVRSELYALHVKGRVPPPMAPPPLANHMSEPTLLRERERERERDPMLAPSDRAYSAPPAAFPEPYRVYMVNDADDEAYQIQQV